MGTGTDKRENSSTDEPVVFMHFKSNTGGTFVFVPGVTLNHMHFEHQDINYFKEK